MRQSFDDLMQAVNCVKFPERWREFYDTAMEDFEKNGTPLTNPSYYGALFQRYDIRTEYGDVYKKAASAVAKNENLSRFLALLVWALADREHIFEDLKAFKAPKSPSVEHDIAYDMLTGLAICSLLPYCHGLLVRRGLPDDVIRGVLSLPVNGIGEYRKRNGGADGYHLLEWFQRAIEGRLFRVGRLEIELAAFRSRAVIFRNQAGESVALANDLMLHRSGRALGSAFCEDETGSFCSDVTETDDSFCGYGFGADGLVLREKTVLPKAEWEKVVERGDPVISLHIPPTGSLSPEAVDATLVETKAFLARYFPEFRYKAFFCGSWLLDPQLEEMLGAESNIVKFGKRFSRMTAKSDGKAVFGFVFLKPGGSEIVLSELPENTRLERALKVHYLAGNAVYEVHGYFL